MKKSLLFILLIAIYPILSLYAYNINEAPLEDLLRPLLLSVLLAGVLFGLALAVIRNARLAGMVSSLAFLAFCSYGQIYRFARDWQIGSLEIGRHRILAPLFALLILVLIWAVSRLNRSRLDEITQAANWFSLALLLLPMYQFISGFDQINWPQKHTNPVIPAQAQTEPADYPDVYYIIIDSYARADYIEENIHYDNSPFLNQLAERGFYTVKCGLSNYAFTRLSLGTSLNMDYIEQLGSEYTPENREKSSLNRLIKESRVVSEFKRLGYTTVAFNTGFGFTELTDADYYFAIDSDPLGRKIASDFERLFIDNTLLTALRGNRVFVDFFGLDFPYYPKYQMQLFTLEKLKEAAAIPGPKFVFAHLLTTHRPYIFDSDGGILHDQRFYEYDGFPASDEDFEEGYQHSLDFTNAQLLEIIDHIQSESARPAVIILQGDHGVMQPGRMSILNSILIPGGSDQLSETETPVNTFRIVFNAIAGTDYPLLEDLSQFSADEKPFVFSTIDPEKVCEVQ